MPPLGFRYGWNLAREQDQLIVLTGLFVLSTSLLVGAPTCSPWSANSWQWPVEVREARRSAGVPGLLFLEACVFTQWLMGRSSLAEQPVPSVTFEKSPLRFGLALPGFSTTVLDQCQYGAEFGGVPARKATELLADFAVPSV